MNKSFNLTLKFLVSIILIIGFVLISMVYSPKLIYDWSSIRQNVKDTSIIISNDINFTYNFNYPDSIKVSIDLERRRWLMNNASEQELEQLLNYPSGNVVATAFEGLVIRENENIYKHLLGILYDTNLFIRSIGEDRPVVIYCLDIVLGMDSVIYGVKGPPHYGYETSILNEQRFTNREVFIIDSIYKSLDYNNYSRFVKYIDFR